MKGGEGCPAGVRTVESGGGGGGQEGEGKLHPGKGRNGVGEVE